MAATPIQLAFFLKCNYKELCITVAERLARDFPAPNLGRGFVDSKFIPINYGV